MGCASPQPYGTSAQANQSSSAKETAVKLGTGVLGTAIAIATATASLPASAHHSYAMFDVEKNISVEGTVKQFMWTNPHSWIRMEVMDAKGQPKEWAVEMGSLTILVSLG